jgi:hypothetical protein
VFLVSSTKAQKLMRKTRRSKGRNVDFYVINIARVATQPIEFHIGDELIVEQREGIRMLLYDDFPELLQHVDSPLESQQDHHIETTGPMN